MFCLASLFSAFADWKSGLVSRAMGAITAPKTFKQFMDILNCQDLKLGDKTDCEVLLIQLLHHRQRKTL